MAITNGYASLNEIKARLSISVSDTQDDAMLEACVEAASRQIDAFTGTRFYQASEVRYFTPLDGLACAIDDATAVSLVEQDLQANRTYSETLTATDWELSPYNAALDGKPYQQIRIRPDAVTSFIVQPRGVKVTGTFGWSATAPVPVKQACLLQAALLFRRKDAPFGVAGGGEVGQSVANASLDPQARLLLTPYRRFGLVSLV